MRALIPIHSRELSQASIDTTLAMQWAPASQIDLLTFAEGDIEALSVTDAANVQAVEDLAVELQQELQHCEVSLFVRSGIPEDQIALLATVRNSDFIIMGSNDGEAPVAPFASSISDRVLNSAPCPVIVGRANNIDALMNEQNSFNCVLIPIDDSVWTDAALQWIASLRWPDNVRFVLAAVIESPGASTANSAGFGIPRLSEENRQMLEVAQQFLGLRARQLAGLTGLRNISFEVGFGDTVSNILQLSRRLNADLIVMGSRGKSGIKKAILGSTSQAVSAHALCSVAIVRGLLDADRGWNKTGAFTKPKAAPQSQTPARPRQIRRNTGQVPHIVPSGIG